MGFDEITTNDKEIARELIYIGTAPMATRM